MNDNTRADDITLTTVRLDVTYKDGHKGAATAFFYEFDLTKGKTTCLITNRHVLKDASTIVSNAHPAIDSEGYFPNLEYSCEWKVDITEKGLLFHPDESVDLAIMLVGPAMKEHYREDSIVYCYRAFCKSSCPTNEEIKQITVMHDIVMVGYPNGLIDEAHMMPVCRRGMIATSPLLNFNGERAFLIDIACTPGSSGSPVIAYDSIWEKLENGQLRKTDQARLIGIFSEGNTTIAQGATISNNSNTSQPVAVRFPYGIGKVIKFECLDDFVPLLEKLCK